VISVANKNDLPWLHLNRKSDVATPEKAPIPLESRSNGEYFHAQTPHEKHLHDAIMRRADEGAARLGIERRCFLASTVGMATSLAMVNLACSNTGDEAGGTEIGDLSDAGRGDGNGYDVGDDLLDEPQTCEKLGSQRLDADKEFIFDIQTHHVNPNGPWRQTNPLYATFLSFFPQAGCGLGSIECLGVEQYIEQIFINSDTSVAVLSSVPAALCSATRTSNCDSPLRNEEIIESRELVNSLAHSERVLNHCMIVPNMDLDEQLAVMEAVHSESKVAAWKCYPPWGPTGTGWRMDDPAIGLPFIQKGIDIGVPTFCIHKGIPLPGFDTKNTDPADVGVVAKQFPEGRFVVYHSGFKFGSDASEGPYSADNRVGTNSLIKAIEDNQLGPNSNVYAELGSVWGNVLSKPDEAAHVLGKLLKYVGEDNVLWGTDCIWTGSPQPLIEAFRAFEISEEFQEKYGYPALTDEIKRKVLGLNSAAVYNIDVAAMRCTIKKGALSQVRRRLDQQLGPRRWVFSSPAGPRTRREFLAFLRWNNGQPG
jgi:hypothetical protein